MKYRASFLLIFLLAFSLLPLMTRAQSLDKLTNLHPRPKVSYVHSTGMRTITRQTVIFISDTASGGTIAALNYLQSMVQQKLGFTLVPVRGNFTIGDSNAIYLGERGAYPALDSALNTSLAIGETMPTTDGGYVLDISQNGMVLAGTDSNGTFNSISTFVQLLQNDSLPTVHINDWPDYPIRWVFSGHNLIEQSQIAQLESIEDTMAAHKLNGLQQNDFKNNIYSVFENSYPQYFYNVDSLQAYSAKSNVELIPGVFPFGWSEGILFHDPDLAEGIPTTTSFVLSNGTSVPLVDPNMILPNGGFENVSNGVFTGWSYYDGPNQSVFVDSSTVHSGKYSARCTDFTAGNPSGDCRFIRSMLCQPFHGYRMSVWINTQNFSGDEVQLLAIGHNGAQSTALTYTAFPVSGTSSGWSQYNVIFNSLTYDSLYVYCGVWGGTAGTIWFDDFAIDDAGLTNVLRRASDLPLVTVRGTSSTYIEGRDYGTIIDTTLEQNEGTYPWHSSPAFTIPSGSSMRNGDTVDVHFIRPNPVENDATGDGSTMVCVSEDSLYTILHDQLQLVDNQYHAGKYFMSHDEIREMNWDSACQQRNVSPAVLLADNVTKSDSIIRAVHSGAEVFDWSDMFDSLHNAHNDYYLVNGDLTGDWNLLPKDFTVVNWNAGFMSQSLDFFSKLGFSQITSPYYDVPNTVNMRDWRLAMDTIPNMRGMMYTTWSNDYSFLTPFADYAWSAGPMIVHTPISSSSPVMVGQYVPISANVFADPYDPTDSIVTVVFREYTSINNSDTSTISYTMELDSIHRYFYATNPIPGDSGEQISYTIQATDKNGLSRTTPRYTLFRIPSSAVRISNSNHSSSLYPNPASNTMTLSGNLSGSLSIIDALGRTVLTQTLSGNNSSIDVSSLSIGTYNCIISGTKGIETQNLLILR